jgi:cytidine deaminase
MDKKITLSYLELNDANLLNDADRILVEKARKATEDSYAPYSGFRVAAAGRLQNGTILTGTNQENASYPVGICAERTLLSTVGALYPNALIETIAITYHNPTGHSDKPVAPCGICRQSLVEYENRTASSIRLILTGYTGKVFIIEKASALLPFSFSGEDMK